jgi:Zn-dependent protease
MEQPPPLPPPPPPFRPSEPPLWQHEPPRRGGSSAWKKILGPIAVVAILFFKWFAKLKFIFIPFLKFFPVLLKTGGTMILSIGAYALLYPWQFAVGLVILIFIHECGHLIAARHVGLPVSAPMFIPFIGAIIALKEAPKNAWIEAQVGIGGPLLGAAGAVLCHLIYVVTGQPLFRLLANVGYLINLFNLAPIGFLDGGRIVTALSPWLWLVGTVIIGVMLVTHMNIILLLVLVLSLPRLFSLFRKRTEEEKRFYEVTPAQRFIIAVLYFGLAAALAVGMTFTQMG